jgi:amino acid transporter
LVSYLAVFFPALDGPVARPAAVLLLLVGLCILTLSGMRNAVGGLVVGSLLKLSPILLLCIVAFASGGISLHFNPPPFDTFQSVALLVFFAYSGTNNAAFAAGEIRNPRRTLPLSMLASLAAIIVFYMVVQWAYISAGAPQSTGNATPLAAAAGALMGETGVVVLTLAAVFSIATNALTFTAASPRIIYGMAERGLLPVTFAHVSPRFLTPDRAILLFFLFVAFVALSGTFEFLAIVTVLASQTVSLGMFATFVLFRLRKHENHAAGLTPFWIAVVAVGVGFAIYAGLQAPIEAYALLVALMVIGGLLSLVARRAKVAHPVPIDD